MLDWKHEAHDVEPYVLIQWESSFPEDSTWEPYSAIAQQYPEFHLEDKVTLEGPGDVMNHSEEEIDYGPEGDEPSPRGKSKRNKTQPKWFKDYVTKADKTKKAAKTDHQS